MDRRVIAVLLAGTLRPPPLREALGRPIVCLPLGRRGTLLDAWLGALGSIDELAEIRVVLKGRPDVEAVNAAMSLAVWRPRRGKRRGPNVHCIAEPKAWRGPGGIVRDVTADLDGADAVIIIEALRLPPPTLRPLVDAFTKTFDGVVGLVGPDQPAGIYVFRQRVVQQASAIGYCDLKEQLIPAVSQGGAKIRTAPLAEIAYTIRDRAEYLAAVRASLTQSPGPDPLQRIAGAAAVSSSALLEGFCVIEPNAVIGNGAVVHDSVVLSQAVIGGGAIVSRSVIGSSVAIAPCCQIVQKIVCEPRLTSAESVFAHGALAG
ncbi:MAG: NDP-sugar synthase [Phycisphaerales bacterium]